MMTPNEKCKELRQLIKNQLDTVIDSDYVLLDLPFYMNIGDTLIWEGELEYLKTLPYKCLNKGFNHCDLSKIDKDTVIILRGGGNFGDWWYRHQQYRLEIIRKYPQNKIVVFPVTVDYKSEDLLLSDIDVLSQHPNLVICARDLRSYRFLTEHLSCQVRLVPDLAFYISDDLLNKLRKPQINDILFLKREDDEYKKPGFEIPKQADVRDWPSLEYNPWYWLAYLRILKLSIRLGNFGFRYSESVFRGLSGVFFIRICKPRLLKLGVGFVSEYKKVYTSRLHVAILRIIMKDEVNLFDNQYGKNSNFYDTWLQNVDGVHFLY